MREWFRVEAASKGKGGGEILIYGVIGKRWWDEDTVGAKDFVKELKGLIDAGPGDVLVRINSPGGDVADGIAIHNAIRDVRSRVVCRIESVAYSMASVIALAGRTTEMQDTGQLMIHNPSGWAQGGEREFETALKALRSAKAVLTVAYKSKTGAKEKDIQAWMEETTWMSAEVAKERGFVDEILTGESLRGLAACFDAGAWERWYRGQGPMPGAEDGTQRREGAKEEESDRSDGSDVSGGGGAATEAGESQAEPAPLNGGDAPKETKMSKITAKEIREACPGASAEFVLAQLEACESEESRGIVEVLKAHNAEQAKALAAANAKAASAAPAKPAATADEGLPPLASGGGSASGSGGDPVADYVDAIDALVGKGRSRAEAIRTVAVESPAIHAAYVRAHNGKYGRPAGRFGS
jgi:ATP-dependent protease ClpP protease subunit